MPAVIAVLKDRKKVRMIWNEPHSVCGNNWREDCTPSPATRSVGKQRIIKDESMKIHCLPAFGRISCSQAVTSRLYSLRAPATVKLVLWS